mmetsp:Transcript_4265/g.11573  ORF Transcript_4265/g.11573 Transcript_4265/m.11573 type:complete len:82 (-) Transcript_4265:137-382(-)
MREFDPHGLSMLAWSFAALAVRDAPLMSAISEQAISKIGLLDAAQGLANLAWSFAKLSFGDQPLRDAVSAAARRRLAEFCP